MLKDFKLNQFNKRIDIEYMYLDIMTGKKLRLLIWHSFIGQFVYPVEGDGVKWVDGGYRYFRPLRVLLYYRT